MQIVQIGDRQISDYARVILTLQETEMIIAERGYAGVKKYLYSGYAELTKILFLSSGGIFHTVEVIPVCFQSGNYKNEQIYLNISQFIFLMNEFLIN